MLITRVPCVSESKRAVLFNAEQHELRDETQLNQKNICPWPYAVEMSSFFALNHVGKFQICAPDLGRGQRTSQAVVSSGEPACTPYEHQDKTCHFAIIVQSN